MPDGTRTEIYFLQYISQPYQESVSEGVQFEDLKGVKEHSLDETVKPSLLPKSVTADVHLETRPDAEASRYAYLHAGDIDALVVQTRKGSIPEVPFQQTVRLQAQLLG